jgi:hypothetical protein
LANGSHTPNTEEDEQTAEQTKFSQEIAISFHWFLRKWVGVYHFRSMGSEQNSFPNELTVLLGPERILRFVRSQIRDALVVPIVPASGRVPDPAMFWAKSAKRDYGAALYPKVKKSPSEF